MREFFDNRGLIHRSGDGTKTFDWHVKEPNLPGLPGPIHFGKGKGRVTIDPLGPARKWLGRIGRVERILAEPCSANPGIWVLAAFYGLPTLLLTPIKPSALDYLIIRTGFGHGVRKRKLIDVWDFHFLPQVQKPGIQWVFFSLAGLGARALWYIAVADAITAFAINWISGVYQMAGCTGGDHGDILFSNYAVDGLLMPGSPGGEGYLLPWQLVGGGPLGRGGPYIGGNLPSLTVGGGISVQQFRVPGLPEHLQPKMASVSAAIKHVDSGQIVADLGLVPNAGGYGGSGISLNERRGTTFNAYGMWLTWSGPINSVAKITGTMDAYAAADFNALTPDP